MSLVRSFRQTEAGELPVDWQVKSLREVTEFANGKPHEADICPDGRFALVTLDSVDIQGELKDTHRATDVWDDSLRAGDIVTVLSDLAHGLLLGLSAVIPVDGAFVLNQRMGRLRLKGPGSPGYLRLQINARQEHFRKRGQGTSQRHIYKRDFDALVIPFPEYKEQRAIAEALSDVDALLAGLDRLIAKKRDIKQAAMQQLLTGQTRLPGFQGEWEVTQLGDVAHIKTGSRNNEDKVPDGEYPFFVRSEHVERINTYSHDCEAILVPGEGRIGSIFHYIQGRFDVHQRVYAITQFRPEVSGRFVHLCMSFKFGAWAMQNTVKATVDSLRLPTFQTFEFSLPPTLDEQTAIATVLSDMDAELAALEARRDKTQALKQGMMQELLTGRTRLV
jgi:type I restriction enzyme S subunit